jgi:ATP-dependent RNA helicase DDX5/DBP2
MTIPIVPNLIVPLQDFLKDFIQVNIGSLELSANHNIQQIIEICSDFEKRGKLVKHLDQIGSQNAKVLIFVATKRVADDITKHLREDGWPALAIHGDKEQYVTVHFPSQDHH